MFFAAGLFHFQILFKDQITESFTVVETHCFKIGGPERKFDPALGMGGGIKEGFTAEVARPDGSRFSNLGIQCGIGHRDTQIPFAVLAGRGVIPLAVPCLVRLVVTGIKHIGDHQKRVMTPAQAKEIGSDYIVVGRPITAAEDPVMAYERCCREFLG